MLTQATEKLIDGIEDIAHWISSMFLQNLSDMIAVETADSINTLVMKDGSLISILKISGTRNLIGSEEFDFLCEQVNTSLEAYFSKGGHRIQLFFQHDRESIDRKLKELFEPSNQSAERMGFSIRDINEDRIKAMSPLCHAEDFYMVLHTLPEVLSDSDLKRSREKMNKAYQMRKGVSTISAQNLLVVVDGIRDRHNSFSLAMLTDMNEAGLVTELLTAQAACRAIRMSIDPEFTDDTWEAYLPGDKLPMRLGSRPESADVSSLLWPKLSTQFTPRGGISHSPQHFGIGNRIYSTVAMELAPKTPQSFNSLFKRLMSTDIPWRASMVVAGGGLSALQLKRTFAAIMGFAHSDNNLIVESFDELTNQVKKGNTLDALFMMTFCTWVSDGDRNKLSTRTSQLARAIEGWGVCEVNEVPGDSCQGFMSTALGHDGKGVAPKSAGSLRDIVSMMPLTRPASPWSAGSIIWRTPDGKPWPYSPGSSKQDAWIDLKLARMGSGKSVLENGINLAMCSDPRLTRLPRIGMIDIGESSRGFIDLIRGELPEERKHELQFHRIRMTPDFAVNAFDTILGNRSPISSHRTFLTNFTLLLATPVGETVTYDGIADMVGVTIDETYKRLADGQSAKRYNAGEEQLVDDSIEELDIKVDNFTTWWELTDQLKNAGRFRAAEHAQRHAMPILDDVLESARSEVIRDLYKTQTPTGEPIVDAFCRLLSSAIREYVVISRPTKFDISQARIVSLDLDEVAKTGGDAANRQAAIMYLLARFVLTRDFYTTEESLAEINPEYRAYHSQRIKENSEDIKKFSADEVHRTRHAPIVRQQFMVDIREGRKWGVHVSLTSQNLDDFDDAMISLASNIFLMGKFDNSDIQDIKARFGLSETEVNALRVSTHGPRAGVGTTFLMSMMTNDYSQRASQLVTSTIGPVEYWALTTTAEDKVIRKLAYAKIGGKAGRQLLAKHYPWGIKREVERRSLSLDQGQFDDAKRSSLIDAIFDEMIHHKGKPQRKL